MASLYYGRMKLGEVKADSPAFAQGFGGQVIVMDWTRGRLQAVAARIILIRPGFLRATAILEC